MARLHHTNIRVADPVRSVRFYQQLGLVHVGTAALAPGYTLLYMGSDQAEAPTVELVVNDTDDPSYDRSPGSGHIGIEVDDIDEVLALLASVGVEPEAPPGHPVGRTDLNPVAFVRDPDGVRVELMQSPWRVPADALPQGVAESLGG